MLRTCSNGESAVDAALADVVRLARSHHVADLALGLAVAASDPNRHPVAAAIVARAHEVVHDDARPLTGRAPDQQRDAGALLAALGLASSTLGPRAARQARELFDRFVSFAPTDQVAAALTTVASELVLGSRPQHVEASTLLRRTARSLHPPSERDPWVWPAPTLDAFDGAVPDAFLAAGTRLGDRMLVHHGVVLLDWRLDHRIDRDRPAADHLVEAITILGASHRASRATADPRWLDRARRMVHDATRWPEPRASGGETVDLTTRTALLCSLLRTMSAAPRARPVPVTRFRSPGERVAR